MSNNGNLGTVAFIGIGLIGGSLALALRQAQAAEWIIALDNDARALAAAQNLGVIDAPAQWADLAAADVIVLATPVDALFAVCEQLAALPLKETVVMTDVGSTKASVLSAVEQAFGTVPPFFVPAHPIAGREKSGVAAASGDLFLRRKVILTTLAQTDNRALGVVSRLWHSAGALISQMSVAEHDAILGATSHLPHVLAYLLVDMLDQDLQHEAIFSYAAGGFRDFTRIASSSPVMWRDICLHNPQEIAALLQQYRQRLQQFEQLLAAGDGEAIERIFGRAKAARDAHYLSEI